jgi:glycosyltransferase involved in cell wall biosynthesis
MLNKKEKFYINGRFLTQSISGVQRYAYEFIKTLDELISRDDSFMADYQFEILAPKKLNSIYKLDFKNISLRRIGLFTGHIWEQFELPFLCRNGLLFCPGNTAPVVHLISRQKTVVTVHDLSFRYFPVAYSLPFRMIYKILMPVIFKLADLIITVSNSELNSIVKIYPESKEKIHAVQNGGLPERILKNLDYIPAHETQKPYFLYVGTLNPRKNPQGVISAFNIIQKELEIDLVIVGSSGKSFGDLNYELFEKHKGEIIFTGQIDDTDRIIGYYKGATCLVFPSFYEASPFPPLEAMASGCPVIAGDIPSLRERCKNAALYCDPHDAQDIAKKILAITDDTAFRLKLIHRGFVRNRNFTWLKCVENTSRLIVEIKS